MTEAEKRITTFLVYSMVLAAGSAFLIWEGVVDFVVASALVFGIFGFGYFAAKLDSEHIKNKTSPPAPTEQTKKSKDDEYWESLLTERMTRRL